MSGDSILDQRAKERRKKQRQKRAAQGSAAMDQFKDRSAEQPGAAGGRVDYTPKPPPVVKPPVKGSAAKHPPTQIGPKEGFLKVN
jgi:hypothetical protein